MRFNLPIIRTIIILVFTFTATQLFSQSTISEKDSLTQDSPIEHKRINPLQVLFSGIPIQRTTHHELWYIPSTFEVLQFNTVEGFVFNPSISYTKYLDKGKFYNLKPNLRYGFGNQNPQVKLTALYYYNSIKHTSIELSGGHFAQQLNPNSSLGGFSNTYNTLLPKNNFLKIYESSYLKATHAFILLKNFLLTNSLHWEDRKPLQNLSRFDNTGNSFTSNNPDNIELASTAFNPHQAFLWHTQIKWQLKHAYIKSKGKFISKSDKPAITASFVSTLSDVLGTDVSYQKISFDLQNRYQSKSLGNGQYLIETGSFLSKDSLNFIDFNHFNGNRSLYNSFVINEFQLLDYYQYSTSNFYIQGHLQHKTKEISIGKKPLKILPVLSINYLHTDAINYAEIGLGIEGILRYWRLDLYGSMLNGGFEDFGLRFGYVIKD